MIDLFIKGGLAMWPILALSIISLAVIIERTIFLIAQNAARNPAAAGKILEYVERGDLDKALETAASSRDPTAKVLAFGLKHRDTSLSTAILQAAGSELDRYSRGLVVLDTAVTLGPLLGLLGTVTGMMRAFGLAGAGSIAEKQTVITGGVAEALIAVAFGLGVAIVALVPFNYFQLLLERARRHMENAATQLELLLAKHR